MRDLPRLQLAQNPPIGLLIENVASALADTDAVRPQVAADRSRTLAQLGGQIAWGVWHGQASKEHD
jgi:hypothetical protein